MTNRNATQAIAAVLAVAVAAPLSASARHHRSEDILAGVVIGAIAGTFVAAAASGAAQEENLQEQINAKQDHLNELLKLRGDAG